MTSVHKIPRSVLVLIHSCTGLFLLIERADRAGYWQSVTGSVDSLDEPLVQCCRREVFEETGIEADPERFVDLQQMNEYEIYPQWRHRYAPGVNRNVEHVFALQVDPQTPIRLSPREHIAHAWLDADEAAARCFSPSNAEAIRHLAGRLRAAQPDLQPDPQPVIPDFSTSSGPVMLSPRKPL